MTSVKILTKGGKILSWDVLEEFDQLFLQLSEMQENDYGKSYYTPYLSLTLPSKKRVVFQKRYIFSIEE